MVFKKDLTPIGGKKGQITKHAGKGSRQEVLPSRHALSQLTQGDPADRTMNDYAKASPVPGPNPPQDGQPTPGSFPGLS